VVHELCPLEQRTCPTSWVSFFGESIGMLDWFISVSDTVTMENLRLIRSNLPLIHRVAERPYSRKPIFSRVKPYALAYVKWALYLPTCISSEHNILCLRINMQAFPYTRAALCSTLAIWRNIMAIHRPVYQG